VSKVERDAKMEGRRMTLVLQPEHKAPGAKPPAPGKPAPRVNAPVGRPGMNPAMNAGTNMNIPQPVGAAAAPARPAPTPAPVTSR
jgi:hypothetical protein